MWRIITVLHTATSTSPAAEATLSTWCKPSTSQNCSTQLLSRVEQLLGDRAAMVGACVMSGRHRPQRISDRTDLSWAGCSKLC